MAMNQHDAEGWADLKHQTPEEYVNSHEAIEKALRVVRLRHEKAGDAHKYTFGELLREASKELDEKHQQIMRTGRDKWCDLLGL